MQGGRVLVSVKVRFQLVDQDTFHQLKVRVLLAENYLEGATAYLVAGVEKVFVYIAIGDACRETRTWRHSSVFCNSST